MAASQPSKQKKQMQKRVREKTDYVWNLEKVKRLQNEIILY